MHSEMQLHFLNESTDRSNKIEFLVMDCYQQIYDQTCARVINWLHCYKIDCEINYRKCNLNFHWIRWLSWYAKMHFQAKRVCLHLKISRHFSFCEKASLFWIKRSNSLRNSQRISTFCKNTSVFIEAQHFDKQKLTRKGQFFYLGFHV